MSELILTLKQWRKMKDLSREELAQLSGVTSKTIYNYETDLETLRNAKYTTIKSICKALDITIDNIFLDSVSEKPKEEVN